MRAVGVPGAAFNGRGHWFDPSTAHHSKSGTYVITREKIELRMAAGMADAKISDGGRRWMSMDQEPRQPPLHLAGFAAPTRWGYSP